MREMNKYITALLVVLATTGVEAQNYQSVLKLVLGDVNVEDFYRLKEFKGSEKGRYKISSGFSTKANRTCRKSAHYVLLSINRE